MTTTDVPPIRVARGHVRKALPSLVTVWQAQRAEPTYELGRLALH